MGLEYPEPKPSKMKQCKIFLITILSLWCLMIQTNAQEQPHKLKMTSYVNVAMLNGSKGSSPALQAIIGGNYKGSYFGAGSGLDFYRFRSIPVFLHLAQTVSRKTRGLCLYGDLGYHFEWVTRRNREQSGIAPDSDFGGGIYYQAGIGYRVPLSKRDAFILGTGYSFKKLTREGADIMCPFIGPCAAKPDTYNYSLRRLVISAGWVF